MEFDIKDLKGTDSTESPKSPLEPAEASELVFFGGWAQEYCHVTAGLPAIKLKACLRLPHMNDAIYRISPHLRFLYSKSFKITSA